MDEKLRELVGPSRHGLVSVFLDRTQAPGDMESEPVKLASREWTTPGTSRTHVGRSTVRDRLKPARPAREGSPLCAAGATPCTPGESAPAAAFLRSRIIDADHVLRVAEGSRA